jgi:hypothetical protein
VNDFDLRRIDRARARFHSNVHHVSSAELDGGNFAA